MGEFTEKEAEEFLEKENFNVVKRVTIKKLAELKKIEKIINFPWVMKVESKNIVHKAKVGGVILGINNLKEAEIAFEKLSLIKGFEEAMIQETIEGEHFIIGLKQTQEFGPAIMVGKGGSKVYEEKDITFRIIPVELKDIKEMLEEITYYRKNKEKINIKELEKTILKTSKLAKKYPSLTEFDINPLLVNKNEATIVDARIKLN